MRQSDPEPEQKIRAAFYFHGMNPAPLTDALNRHGEAVEVFDGVVEATLTKSAAARALNDLSDEQRMELGVRAESLGALPESAPQGSHQELPPLDGRPDFGDSPAFFGGDDEEEEQASETGGGLESVRSGENAKPQSYLVEVFGSMSTARAAQLKQLGADVQNREPDGTFRCRMTARQAQQALALSFVRNVRVIPLEPLIFDEEETEDGGGRLEMPQRDLWEMPQVYGDDDDDDDGGLEVYTGGVQEAVSPQTRWDVVLRDAADLTDVRHLLTANFPELKVLDAWHDTLRIATAADFDPRTVLGGITQIRAVRKTPTPTLYDAPTTAAVRPRNYSGAQATLPSDGLLWTGAGECIGIFDSGVDAEHPDLKDRLLMPPSAVDGLKPDDENGHGTHVAGILAGTGEASQQRFCGVAPGAKLVSIAIADAEGSLFVPLNLGEVMVKATQHGAKILNLSWGQGVGMSGIYDPAAWSLDQFAYDNPDVLIVVAAGNKGGFDAEDMVRLQTLGTPACARNVLTVGNYDWAQNIPAKTSCCGPTAFFSVKPDLLAYGTDIVSALATNASSSSFLARRFTKPDEHYTVQSGTSMAAPMVAGAAAIVREYLRKERNTLAPTSALLKAILIASARRIAPLSENRFRIKYGFPDFYQGFGVLDLSSLLPHLAAPPKRKLAFAEVRNQDDDALISRNFEVEENSRHFYRVRLAPDAQEPLRIVLTWLDPPGNALQHNLQIHAKVYGESWKAGNHDHVLRQSEPFDLDENGERFDRTNNIEQIVISNPPSGECQIEVFAESTFLAPQGYALCVCGELETDQLERIK